MLILYTTLYTMPTYRMITDEGLKEGLNTTHDLSVIVTFITTELPQYQLIQNKHTPTLHTSPYQPRSDASEPS